MSFGNTAWGTPGGLPYSIDQQQAPFINAAQAPIPRINISPSMAQVFPMIVQASVEMIQSGSRSNQLRLFFFNQMGQNGFQNDDFLTFLQRACELLEMVLTLNPQANLVQAVQVWVDRYIQFRVVDNLRTFPALQQAVPPQVVSEAGAIMSQFTNAATQMENQILSMQQRGTAWGQQTSTRQPGSAPSWADAASATPSWRGNTPAPALEPAWRRTRPAVQAPPPPPPPAPSGTVTWRREVETPQPATQQVTNVQQPKPALVAKPVSQPSTDIKFVRSDAVPYDSVYNHNVHVKTYIKHESGVSPYVQRIATVDRDKHLGKPSFAPTWIKPPDMDALKRRLNEAEAATESAKPIEFTGAVDTAYLESSQAAQWAKAAANLAAHRPQSKQILCSIHTGALIDSLVSTRDLMPLVTSLMASSTPAEAVTLLQNAIVDCGEFLDDVVAIRTIVARITKRVNRFISKEASLDTGTITDYLDDALELVDYLKEEYGSSVQEIFLRKHKELMLESLLYVAKDYEYVSDLNEPILSDLTEEERAALHVLHFSEYVGFSLLDMNSGELCFDFPQPGKAAGVIEQQTPILYAVVSGIFQRHVVEQSGCVRQLLRTSDGVTFELDRGVFNPEFKLISLA